MTMQNSWLDRFGSGVLGRTTTAVYRALVITALFAATSAPGWVLALLLASDASNIPLFALALLPAGPAFAAALSAWRASSTEVFPAPAASFWRGYRLNAAAVLRWFWLPLLLGTVLCVNLAYLGAVVADPGMRVALGVVQAGLLLLLATVTLLAMCVTVSFEFRAIDTLRIAVRALRMVPRSAVAAAAIAICFAGVAVFASELVVVAVSGLLAALLLLTAQPLLADTEERFTA